MKPLFSLIALSLISMNAMACPELSDTELGDDTMTTIAVEEYQLTKAEANNLDAFKGAFEQCKDYVELKTIRSNKTGRIFKAIASTDHACDGDNVIGAILSADETEVLGNVSDSYISCEEPRPAVR